MQFLTKISKQNEMDYLNENQPPKMEGNLFNLDTDFHNSTNQSDPKDLCN